MRARFASDLGRGGEFRRYCGGDARLLVIPGILTLSQEKIP